MPSFGNVIRPANGGHTAKEALIYEDLAGNALGSAFFDLMTWEYSPIFEKRA